jgi:hypothetical protein
MSELSKNQLTTENNNSFPNNNTGYITPTLLRTFNQNMIDSLVDEQQYNVDSASFNNRINVLDPSGSAQAITALEVASASLNAYTASQNIRNTSYSSSISALQTWSSSLDTTYATDAQLSASVSQLSSSVTITTNGLSSSIGILDSEVNALQSWSSSLDTTYATDTQLSASASTLQNNINSLSQSVAATDLAQSQSIAALQQFSSSLDNTFATDTQLSASASTLQNNINTKLDSASFNTYTQSNDSKVNSLIAATGSYAISSSVASALNTKVDFTSFNGYTSSTDAQLSQIQQRVSASATTGSNTFIGNQIVSGNVNIAGNITAVSASFTYITTVYETASVIFSSGSNQLGDELSDVQTLSGSVRVQGGLTVNGVPVQTSSFDASGYLLTSSFNTYTQSASTNVSGAINTATQSLSSSIAVTTNNNTLLANQKLDSSSFNTYTQSNDTKVNALIAATGSYAISSSVANTFNAFSSSVSLTYATKTELSASASTLQNGINSKVENSTFNTYTQSQSSINQGLSQAIASRLTTASFNSYTSSNDSKVNSLIAATGSYITSAQTSSMSVLSSSYSITASYALNAGVSVDTGSLVTTASFNAYTQSASTNVSASINSATQSLSSSIAVTTNNLDLEVNGKLDSSSFNTYTQSNDSKVNSLISATGSYITSTQTSSMSVLSSSFAVTASYALNVTPTDVSMFVSQSTFNAYTQSNNSVVSALVSATSSYAISSSVAAIDASQDGKISSLTNATASYLLKTETSSFAKVNIQNVFTQNQTISGNLDVTGKITALSASITYLETIYQTSSVVYSSGSNILGDELTDTQTLSGSVLVQGLLRVNGVAPILVGATASYASASISSSYSTNSLSASFAQTASFALNVNPTDVSMFLSASTFNSYTQSNDSKVNSLIAATGSYITSTQTSSMSVLSSSYAVTASFALNATADRNGLITTGSGASLQSISGGLLVSGNFDAIVQPATLSLGTEFTNVVIESTASGVPSTLEITRLGAGPTGDLSGIRLRTISGSVSNNDTLLSSIATGINRHTTTAMTGSVVNTTITSTWATGSGGSRVSYGTTINANAQSASATLTITVGNAASNNAGGTASIAAGLIRIGTTDAHRISTTGSFGPMVLVAPLNTTAFSLRSGSFEVTTPQGSGSFYTNLPITSSGARINGTTIVKDLIVSGTGGGNFGSVSVEGYVSASTLYAQNGLFGNLTGTASFATNAGTSDTSISSSFATNAFSATSASIAATANTAVTASYVLNAVSASYSVSSSYSFNSTTASFALNVQNINTSSLATTGSNTFRDTQYIISGAISGTFVDNAGSIYTQSNAVRHIVNLGSASYASIAVPDPNTLYVITGDEQYVLNSQTASFATTGSNRFNGNQTITGSLTISSSAAVELNIIGNTLLTGSVQGNIVPITIASTTASIDCNLGNFFTLVLANGTNHISASNIRPGQTINLRVTTQSGNAVTCSSVIKQTSGSAYVPTNASGTDILTLVAFDNTTLFMANIKNLV